MMPFLSRTIQNRAFQDCAGILRGIIRVVDSKPPRQLFVNQPELDKNAIPIKYKAIPEPEIQNIVDNQQTVSLNIDEKSVITPPQVDKVTSLQENKVQTNIPTIKSDPIELRENKVPESSFSRAWQFSQLGLSMTSNAVKKVISTSLSSDRVSFKQALISEENANILAKGLCKMRGAPLKLAQALSIQEDELIPPSIRKAFEQARQNADVMPQSQLEKQISPILSIFDSFEMKPFAAASIGQVHKAVLNGKPVAVKIQYPGVRQSVDSDLGNIKRIMDYTGVFPKTMFLDKLIANTRKELMQECDYTIEAQKQIRYKEMILDQKEFYVPSVYPQSTSQNLISDYIEGDSLDFVAENYPQALRNEIGSRIMNLTLQELFKFRYMQTDPNPSNFYFNRNTHQLILLDFGAVHEYSKEFIDDYIEVIHGASTGDRKKCLERSVSLGFLTGEESIRMKEAHVDSIQVVGEPFKENKLFDFSAQQITSKIYELMPIMLKYRLRPPPPEVYSLHRKLSGAYLMNIRLKTQVNCYQIFHQLYRNYH